MDLAERWVGDLRGKRVLVLGLSFKEGTDDIRESPGITVVINLLERGASVVVADPLVKKEQLRELLETGAEFAEDPVLAFKDAEICFITTSASEFKFIETALNSPWLGTKRPIVVDGRRVLSRKALSAEEKYVGIGAGHPLYKIKT